MIGKIFTIKHDYGCIYLQITKIHSHNIVDGKIIRSNCPTIYVIGSEYGFYLPTLTEISQEQFNKIMAFE